MDLREKIWQWAEKLDDWQNDLLRRIYEGSISEDDLGEVRENLIAFVCDEKFPHTPERLSKEQIQTSLGEDIAVKILELFDIKNVGSLSGEDKLKFLPQGLTVIYGENGAGKSSYAQVLKKACRAVEQDFEIHPNAFKEDTGVGEAKIKIDKNGTETTINRKVNDKPIADLKSVSIYDKECAEVYTDGNTIIDIPYLPFSLKALKKLSDLQGFLKTDLDKEQEGLRENLGYNIEKLEDFPKDDIIYPEVFNQDFFEIDISELKKKKGVDEDQEKRLEQIKKQIALSDPKEIDKKIDEIISKKKEAKNISDRLKVINDKLRVNKTFPELLDKIYSLKRSQQQLKQDFEDDLPGTGNDVWKNLWEAARKFSEEFAYPSEEYPVLEKDEEVAKCVLCQQNLEGQEVRNRFKRFDEYIEHDIEKQLSKYRKIRDKFVSELNSLELESLLTEQIRNTLKEIDHSIIKRLDEINESYQNSKDQIIISLNEESWQDDIEKVDVEEVREDLEKIIKRFEEQIKSYRQLKDSDKLQELELEKLRLEAKQELDEKFEVIKEYIENNRSIKILDEAKKNLNTGQISSKVNDLSSNLVTDEIEKQLNKERKRFKVSHFPISIHGRGRSGEAKSELEIENDQNINADEILSEGEQNAISLAYFLAEISHSDHNGSLIFDDPVSSLDDIRRSYVARRIAELSLERQVIVFTHDIYFVTLLNNEIKRLEREDLIDHYWVWSNQEYCGKVENSIPWRRKPPQDMIQKPCGKLEHFKNTEQRLNPEEKREIASQFYKYLRITWEAAIEKRLLKGVVKRFDNRVMVGKVKNIDLTEETKEQIDKAWRDSSQFLHYEGDLSSLPPPTKERMEKDLKALKCFIEKHKN